VRSDFLPRNYTAKIPLSCLLEKNNHVRD